MRAMLIARSCLLIKLQQSCAASGAHPHIDRTVVVGTPDLPREELTNIFRKVFWRAVPRHTSLFWVAFLHIIIIY